MPLLSSADTASASTALGRAAALRAPCSTGAQRGRARHDARQILDEVSTREWLFAPLGASLVGRAPRQHSTLARVPACELIGDRIDHRVAVRAKPFGIVSTGDRRRHPLRHRGRPQTDTVGGMRRFWWLAPLLFGAACAAEAAPNPDIHVTFGSGGSNALTKARDPGRAVVRDRRRGDEPAHAGQAHDPRRQGHGDPRFTKNESAARRRRDLERTTACSRSPASASSRFRRHLRRHVLRGIEWTIATQR